MMNEAADKVGGTKPEQQIPLGGDVLVQLGQRIRTARQQQGMTQQDLATPGFSAGYVSALERGVVRPSLKALDIFARRLGLQLSEFLVEPQSLPIENEHSIALEEELHHQLDYARMLINTDKLEEALDLIAEVQQRVAPHLSTMSQRARYRIPQTRAMAYIRKGDNDEALRELYQALELAEENNEDSIRIRNLIGAVYYQSEQPQLALEQHLLCLRAVQDGTVRDPIAQIGIYRNLANAYWALHQVKEARAIYLLALSLLDGLDNLEHQASIFWGLAMTYKAEEDWARARLTTTRALNIFEAAGKRAESAALCLNLTEMILDDPAAENQPQRHTEALDLLLRGERLLIGSGDQALQSVLNKNYAKLSKLKKRLDEAANYAAQSVTIAETLVRNTPQSSKQPWISAQRTYAEALHTQALIEEARGNAQQADSFFLQAIEAIKKTGFKESLHTVIYSYGEVLEQRGEGLAAMKYYKDAARVLSNYSIHE